jgi:peptidoglycan DL-endopeptidase CwlO
VNGKRRLATLFVLVGTLVLSFALASPALGTPLSEKKAKLARVQAQLQTVYHKADIAVEKYNQASDQLKTVQQKIKENARLLKVAEYNLAIAVSQLQARAEKIYKTRDVSLVDVLFASNTFDDLVTQLDLIERIGDNDVDTVTAISAYRADIKDRRAKLQEDREAAADLVKQRAEQKNEILALENELESMTAGIKSDIRRLEAEQREAARRAAEAAQGGGGSDPGPIVDPGGSGRSAVVAIAQRYLGVPYVYGGASPSGFDCSGLTMYCYAQIGIGMAHGATLQQKASTPVPISALQPGDLVFFGNSAFSYHVGIYVGGSTMIHAPHTGDVVRYGDMSNAWIGGRF